VIIERTITNQLLFSDGRKRKKERKKIASILLLFPLFQKLSRE
jgi:hypothetical protein